MTNLSTRVSAIRAECEEVLRVENYATPGRWSNDGQGPYINTYDKDGNLASSNSIAKCYPEDYPLNIQMKRNADFITLSRTVCPKAARVTLAAIDADDWVLNGELTGKMLVGVARRRLQAIAEAWEGKAE